MPSQDVKYLPSEIILNILLRIPVRTVMRCKCVCKAWRDLLETPEFVKSHISNSVTGLAVYLRVQILKRFKILEVSDDSLNIAFSFDLPFISCYCIVHSSANGLLFMCNKYIMYPFDVDLFVCNPITREYISLPSALDPPPVSYKYFYGFGVSKMSGEYKVVRISFDVLDGCRDCQVYTVGTGYWRRIAHGDQIGYKKDKVGAFFNGNLHWMAYKIDPSNDLICCLDLETEHFSTFCPPSGVGYNYRILCVLGNYLCVCDTSFGNRGLARGIDIWLMKEYGNEKSWTKEFHFDTDYGYGPNCPIKVLNDGDILMQWGNSILLNYSKKHGRETIEKVDLFRGDDFSCATIYAPSLLPLRTFAMENVSSF